METPSSTRRITRSQTKAAMNCIPNSGKNDESEIQLLSRQRKGKIEQRSALIDITNDSPITGLAVGFLETPLSQAKTRDQPKKTPGSGEILLRGQVKTLLQKVEEEAELVKLSAEHRSFINLRDLVRSPSGLLAPTPNNTPNVPNLSNNIDVKVNVNGVNGLISAAPSDAEQETQQETMAFDESEKNLITRSLLLDFSEKSEISDSSSPCSSVLTSQETEKSTEEDDASVWSIQVNASSIQDEDEDEDDKVAEEDHYDEEEEDYEECEDGDLLDELCEGLGKISVQEKKLPAFAGKHTRFIYNSDGELEGEEVMRDKQSAVSPSILRLKGMPTPVGKHIRFNDDEEDEV